MSEFGKLLKSLRTEKKISQRKLAELVEIDFTYISKIENGMMEPPSETTIIKIARVLEVDPDKMVILANKVPTGFQKVILENAEVPAFLRKVPNLSAEQWEKINDIISDKKDEK